METRAKRASGPALAGLLALALWACDAGPDRAPRPDAATAPISDVGEPPPRASHGEKQAFFGDLHVHTRNSFDAYTFGVRASPADAYRYGRGEPIEHVSGVRIQASRPIDFMAVTDHAEYLGLLRLLPAPDGPLADTSIAREIRSGNLDRARAALEGVLRRMGLDPPTPSPELVVPELSSRIWRDVAEVADRFYTPGVFTTLVGFEWTSTPDARNLHRNVLFRGRELPALPFSSFDSGHPEDLWRWLDELRQRGIRALAIPHNSNVSDGSMFALEDSWGRPIDAAWADARLRNEPLVEGVQIKGSSETHPLLSPTDEWADFEILETLLGRSRVGQLPGSYLRDAWRRGLRLHAQLGRDPFRFGVIGSSDSHNASVPVEESRYTGKIGVADGTPEARLEGSLISPSNLRYSAAGLAGVWARENTREQIFDALARKEVFATSGPRIALHLSAAGRPMGSELPAGLRELRLRVEAIRDPDSAPLQRLQIVKGWLADGELHERVIDVACSDGGVPDPVRLRCPDNGATLDLSTCAIPEEPGDAQLTADWRDPDFDPNRHAFYYARVLENPSCRWSTWDALRGGWDPPASVPAAIQERAWSSPLWVVPGSRARGRNAVQQPRRRTP